MSTTLTILRNRRKRRTQPNHRLEQGGRNISVGCGFTLSLLLIFGIFSLVLSYQSLTNDLPTVEKLETLLNPRNGTLLQPTRILDRSSEKPIYIFAPEGKARRYIPLGVENLQHIPNSLTQATLALADPTFWEHPGYSLADLDNPEIHVTLAQRLVVDLLLWDEEPSLRRAIRERLLAAQITKQYGRQQILEWYLNSANYGHHAYGAEAAAQLYFGKALTELDLAESATLAAVSQIPALNPIDAPTAAYQRRQEALHILVGLEIIDADEAEAALRSPFNLLSFEKPENLAPAFVALILDQLEEFYPRERIMRGGLTIISTLDLDLQKDATCAVKTQIARLSGVEAEACDAARLLPALPTMGILNNISANALILDPVNGQILALIGEMTLTGESSQIAVRKAGSSLSPFVYLTGFTRGLSPASLLWDIPRESNIQNFDGQFHGPMRLRTALANDYLVPMEGVLAQMGSENVTRISQSFGLDFDAMDIKDAMFSSLDLAQAYGVFAAEGVMYGQILDENLQAVTILEMRDIEEEIWLDWREAESQPVVTPQLAYLMNDILSDGSARWQSLGTDNTLDVGMPAAAKIGRVDNDLSAWTVGYTPQHVALVWMGANEPFDPEVVAGIWHALIKTASAELPSSGWDVPVGITRLDVCDPSGLLPTADCLNIVSEAFLNATEPSQYDNLYRSFEVNLETGYLATVFTPPELIEEKIYMLVPAEARNWAESAGLAMPPDSYDAILIPPHLSDANFSTPKLFSDVSGVLEMRGTAAGDDFDYYRIQVGQGLNPQTWIQIGEDIHEVVLDDVLTTWDTSELNGLYAIQLLVVQKDKRVEIATTQVSIDNEPPTMRVLFPQEGETLDYLRNRQINFRVQAYDNLGIESVEFSVNFQQIGVATESPYIWTWAASVGNHHLKVIVRDRAGNVVEEILRFKVEK